MGEKLLRLMKSEGLTSSRLAEILGTGASNISHIISGRSKPGYDLLRKILLSFPQINPDWLLLDDETMYRSDETPIREQPVPIRSYVIGSDVYPNLSKQRIPSDTSDAAPFPCQRVTIRFCQLSFPPVKYGTRNLTGINII